MKAKDYQVVIQWSDEDEAYIARVPAIPGCMSDGETAAEAAENIQEAIELSLETLESNGFPIPEPDMLLHQLRALKPVLKISQLAKLAGMPPSTLSSKIERGGPFSVDERLQLHKATNSLARQ